MDKKQFTAMSNMRVYLREISQILLVPISKSDLLSLTETADIYERLARNQLPIAGKIVARFADMRGENIRNMVEKFGGACPSGFYLANHLSRVCGLTRPLTARDLNYSFNATDSSGLFSLIDCNLAGKIVFDFDKTTSGEWIEVESYGEDWTVLAN